jgi:hypothetical protein
VVLSHHRGSARLGFGLATHRVQLLANGGARVGGDLRVVVRAKDQILRLLVAQDSLQGSQGADGVLQVGVQAVLASPDRVSRPLEDRDTEGGCWGKVGRPELELLRSLQGEVKSSG